MKLRKRLLKIGLGVGALVGLVLVLFHLAWPPVYRFPEARPFSGPNWHNPYEAADARGAAVENTDAGWLKANFHSHSRSWGGLARRGRTYPTEILWKQYESIGYDVIGISNYQSIRPAMPGEKLYIPAYEHGFSITQQHQTVLGARAVSWFDFPIYQGVRQKQCVIDSLRAHATAVILNHPNKTSSYSTEDLKQLTGYTGIEVASKYARGAPHWDAALSAGRPVWGFCGDDGHDIERLRTSGTAWLMVQPRARTPQAVLDALGRGRFYGVWARQDRVPNALEACRIDQGRLDVRLQEPADMIRFVGQGGEVKAEARDARESHYVLTPTDTYIRVEAETRATTLFLNPVFRYEGASYAVPEATVATGFTWFFRGVALLIGLGAVGAVGLYWRRRKA